MRERRHALAVREVHVSAGLHQKPDDLGVSCIAAAEDDRLEQRSPAEPVHVIDLDVGLEEPCDDRREPAVGRSDEPGPVVAVERADVGAVRERELEEGRVVADLARGDEIRALDAFVLRVHVGAGLDQLACARRRRSRTQRR